MFEGVVGDLLAVVLVVGHQVEREPCGVAGVVVGVPGSPSSDRVDSEHASEQLGGGLDVGLDRSEFVGGIRADR